MIVLKLITFMKLIILTFILYTVFTGFAGAEEYKLELEITLQPKHKDNNETDGSEYYLIMYHKDDEQDKKSLNYRNNTIIETSVRHLDLGNSKTLTEELSIDDNSPITLFLEILENDTQNCKCFEDLKEDETRRANNKNNYDYLGKYKIEFNKTGICSFTAKSNSGNEVQITIKVKQTTVAFTPDFRAQMGQFPDSIRRSAKISKPVSAPEDIGGTIEKISLDNVLKFKAIFNGRSFIVNDGYESKKSDRVPRLYDIFPESSDIPLGQENSYVIRVYYIGMSNSVQYYEIKIGKEKIIYDETVKIIQEYRELNQSDPEPLLFVYDINGDYLRSSPLLSFSKDTLSQEQLYIYLYIDSDLDNKLQSNDFGFNTDIQDSTGEHIDTVDLNSTYVQSEQKLIRLSLPAGDSLYSLKENQRRLHIKLVRTDGEERHTEQIYNVFHKFIKHGTYNGFPSFKTKLKEPNELDFRVQLEENEDPTKVHFDSQDTSNRLINFTPTDKPYTSQLKTNEIKELYTSFIKEEKFYIKYFVYEKTKTNYKVIDSYIVFDLTTAPSQMAAFSLSGPENIKLKGWSVNNGTLVTDNEGSIQLATLYDEFERSGKKIILYPPAEETKYAPSNFSDKFLKFEASNFKKGYNFENRLEYRVISISPTDFEGFCPTALVRVNNGDNTDTLVKFVTSDASFDPHYGGDNKPGKIHILKNGDWKRYNEENYSVELRNIESIEPIGLNSLARIIINQKNHKQLIDILEQKKPLEWISFFPHVNGIDVKFMDSPKAKNHNLSFVITGNSRENKTIPLLESHASSLFKGMKFSDEEVSFIENSDVTCYIADGNKHLDLKLEKSMFFAYKNDSFRPTSQDIVIHLVIVNANRPYDNLQYLWSCAKSPLATALNSVRQDLGHKRADIKVYILHRYQSILRCDYLKGFSLTDIDNENRSSIMRHLIGIQFKNMSGIGIDAIGTQIEKAMNELKGSLDTTKRNYLGVITYGYDNEERMCDNTKNMNNSEPISFSKICSVNGIDGILTINDNKGIREIKNELIELFKSFFNKLLSE